MGGRAQCKLFFQRHGWYFPGFFLWYVGQCASSSLLSNTIGFPFSISLHLALRMLPSSTFH